MSASYAKYIEYRDAKGFKDADVTRDTGITGSTFSDWKSGRSKPKIEKLSLIAKCLGVRIEDLVEEGR